MQRDSFVYSRSPLFKEHYLCIKSHIQRALLVCCASNPIFKEHHACIKSHIQRALPVYQTRVFLECAYVKYGSRHTRIQLTWLESGNLDQAHQVYTFPSIAKKILFFGTHSLSACASTIRVPTLVWGGYD